MRSACLLTVLVTVGLTRTAQAQVYVIPHVRSDGAYVSGHYRTAPDLSVWNNWGTYGNVNPYTGARGTYRPYAPGATYTYRPYVYRSYGIGYYPGILSRPGGLYRSYRVNRLYGLYGLYGY